MEQKAPAKVSNRYHLDHVLFPLAPQRPLR